MSDQPITITVSGEAASAVLAVLDCVAGDPNGPRRHTQAVVEQLEQAGVTWGLDDAVYGAVVLGGTYEKAKSLLETELTIDEWLRADEEAAA